MKHKIKKIIEWLREEDCAVQGTTDSRGTGDMFRGFGRKILWLCTEGTWTWLLPRGGRSLPTEHLLWDRSGSTKIYFRRNYIGNPSFDPKIHTTLPLKRPAVFRHQEASQLHVLPWINWNGTKTTNPVSLNFNLISYLHLVFTRFLFPSRFITTFLCAFFYATCPTHLDIIWFLFFYNKTNKMHWIPKYILSWTSTCFGQFVCPFSVVYSLYTQQWYMSYRFVHSLLAGKGWKKMHNLVFLHAYKSGTPKYRVRAKGKYPYWQINWCNCSFFFDVCDIEQNTKIINWKSWNIVCFLLCFTLSNTCEWNTVLKYCPAVFHSCNTNINLCILCSLVYLPVCPFPEPTFNSCINYEVDLRNFCLTTKNIEWRFS